jgi:ribonuclease HII
MVIGVDEAGRGALAGPVVAAAVLLDPLNIPVGINDSKVLAPQQREELELAIQRTALAWSVSFIDHHRIDEVNILQATYDAMHAAIDTLLTNDRVSRHLNTNTVELFIDGNRFRPHRLPHTCIIKGDATHVEIGAASILAKVARDRFMTQEAHILYPDYGFNKHKGYGTMAHRRVIVERGPCPLHRMTFLGKVLASV